MGLTSEGCSAQLSVLSRKLIVPKRTSNGVQASLTYNSAIIFHTQCKDKHKYLDKYTEVTYTEVI